MVTKRAADETRGGKSAGWLCRERARDIRARATADVFRNECMRMNRHEAPQKENHHDSERFARTRANEDTAKGTESEI